MEQHEEAPPRFKPPGVRKRQRPQGRGPMQWRTHQLHLETEAQRSAAGVQLVKPGAKRQSENKNAESLTFRASPQIFTELFKWMHSLIHFVISSF